jgi:hypothetical protein
MTTTIHTITSGDLYIATKAGEAMFFHDSIDFGQYAGTDGGWTKYRLEFLDAAGKKAWAYAGDRGGGRAFGPELFLNADFSAWTGSAPNFWSVGGWDANNYVAEHPNGLRMVSNGTSVLSVFQSKTGLNTGSIYSVLATISDHVLGQTRLRIRDSTVSASKELLPAKDMGWNTNGNYEYSFNLPALLDESVDVRILRNLTGTDLVYAYCGFKKTIDIPTTGLHLLSTKNGSTRNMESVESGFNPNTVVKVTVTKVGSVYVIRNPTIPGILYRG